MKLLKVYIEGKYNTVFALSVMPFSLIQFAANASETTPSICQSPFLLIEFVGLREVQHSYWILL